MTENLPNQPEQNDWQEKLELHANAARLDAAEVSNILGSLLVENRSEFDEKYAADTISDYAHGDEIGKINGALAELAGLQVSTEDTQEEFGSELGLLAVSLKREQEGYHPHDPKRQELGGRRAAISYLLEQFDEHIIAPQKEIEKGVKPGEFRDAVREWTNQTIESHNARVGNKAGKTITDSPEIREAQERINAQHAEQPQPIETVDDARRKVEEVFGDTGEKERLALIGEVAQAAKGGTRIYTDIPRGVELKSNSGDYRPVDGFNSFGDGLPQDSSLHAREKLEYSGAAEAFIFEPDTTARYKTATRTVETRGRFIKKAEQIEEQIPDGEIPTMVVNSATGKQEPGIKVAYQFNGNQRRENGQTLLYEGPDYMTESKRRGNQLFVEATLPKSVADKLRQGIANNPGIAREFAKTLSLNNGITEQVWDNAVRPPYDQIPKSWEITIADLQKDTQYGDVRHKVVSRQTVKASH